MASKTTRKTEGLVGAIGATIGAGFIDFLRDTLSIVSHRVRDDMDVIMDQMEFRLVTLQKRMFTQVFGYALLFGAALFMILAAYFFLTASLGIAREWVFLGIAIILGIIGLVFKYKAEGV